MELPGANQMIHLRKLMESHSLLDRIPDQSLIKENSYAAAERIQATRGRDYLFVYTAAGKSFDVFLGKIEGTTLKAYWYDPRTGKSTQMENIPNSGTSRFQPPTSGYGHDWVLVLEELGKY
jgi:hypothetical protein